MQTYQQFLFEGLSPSYAYMRALRVGHRVPELEDIIKTDPASSFGYAKYIIKGRWPEAEKTVLTDVGTAFRYFEDVLCKRWTEAEEVFKKAGLWEKYKFGLYDKVRPGYTTKWTWLKQGVTENLVDILNYLSMLEDMQEYICQHRPDLIGSIKKLSPRLKKKYSHEVELGRTDL